MCVFYDEITLKAQPKVVLEKPGSNLGPLVNKAFIGYYRLSRVYTVCSKHSGFKVQICITCLCYS